MPLPPKRPCEFSYRDSILSFLQPGFRAVRRLIRHLFSAALFKKNFSLFVGNKPDKSKYLTRWVRYMPAAAVR
jgi:hypothetical protein